MMPCLMPGVWDNVDTDRGEQTQIVGRQYNLLMDVTESPKEIGNMKHYQINLQGKAKFVRTLLALGALILCVLGAGAPGAHTG